MGCVVLTDQQARCTAGEIPDRAAVAWHWPK